MPRCVSPCGICDAERPREQRSPYGCGNECRTCFPKETKMEPNEVHELEYRVRDEELYDRENDEELYDRADDFAEPLYNERCDGCGGVYSDHYTTRDGDTHGCVGRTCDEGFYQDTTRTVTERVFFVP